MIRKKISSIVLLLLFTPVAVLAQQPVYFSNEILPLQKDHVHGSYLVTLKNGDVLATWFQGSGERWSDDVKIMGARLRAGQEQWTQAFVMADVPDFPDINPVLFVDREERLWLVWYTVMANQWETSLLKYRISEDYLEAEAPVWNWQDVIHVKPGGTSERGIQDDDPFVASVAEQARAYTRYLYEEGHIVENTDFADSWPQHVSRLQDLAAGQNMIRSGRLYREDGSYENAETGYAYFRRMGWQTRNQPFVFEDGRIVLPLYSDGFSFSLMAITDDGGKNWTFSTPLVGAGNIQAALVQDKDGMLTAYMRDNGPPPKRLQMSTSSDRGQTWSGVRDSDILNPGAGADAYTLDNGNWVMVYNDTEQGRHSLAIALSEDAGNTWPYKRHLEKDDRGNGATTAHYPAIVQGQHGDLHITYSYHHHDRGEAASKTVKYVRINESWIRSSSQP